MRFNNHILFFIVTTIILIAGAFTSTGLFAWNQVGHKVVAQIAYDNLTPATKKEMNQLTQIVSSYYPYEKQFIDSAIWADSIIYRGDVTAFNQWHYVNIPINRDGKHKKYYSKTNVIWAINQAKQVLFSKKANNFEKSLFLRFLIHFVGDIHQPLHAASLYSRRFPKGDRGGNLYIVHYKGKRNLHQVWDQCFTMTNKKYPDDKAIKKLARQLENQYAKKYFEQQLKQTSPALWAKESHQIAKDFVYQTPYQGKFSRKYLQTGKKICQQRIVLAGYRLAELLNE